MAAAAPLLKIPLLLATAYGISVGMTSPRPPPGEEERRAFEEKNGEAMPAVGSYGLVPFKVITYAAASLETSLLLAGTLPLARAPWLAESLAAAGRLHTTTCTVLGALLVCAGAALRSACYRRLGAHFTFQLSIQKDHRLVTDGPYARVRHPGYTALVAQAAGLLLVLLGPGSWWREAAAATFVGRALGAGLALLVAVCLACGIDRTYKEDAMLSGLFGEQWAEWAQRTRFRMIPYVF